LAEDIGRRKLSKFRDLIYSCPLLSDSEKSLLVQIDIEEKTVTQIAKELGKAKSTVSDQRSKAFQKLTDWWHKPTAKASTVDFDALVFQMLNTGKGPAQVIAKYGHAEKVRKLAAIWKEIEYDNFWRSVTLLNDFGAFSDIDEDSKRPLLNGVARLCDMVNEAEWAKEEAEKKLAEFEREYGSAKMIFAEKVKLRKSIGGLEKLLIIMREEFNSLPKEIDVLRRKKGIAEDEIRGLNLRIEELNEQAVKALINRDLLQSQLTELKKHLAYYKTTHGRNVKIGDLISKKDYPLLYLVVGESEDKNSWEVKIFDHKQLNELRKKHGLSKETMEGRVSKKEVIENWEIVNIGDEVSGL